MHRQFVDTEAGKTFNVWPHANKLGTFEVSVLFETATGRICERSTVAAKDADEALAKVIEDDTSPRTPVAAINPEILAAFSVSK